MSDKNAQALFAIMQIFNMHPDSTYEQIVGAAREAFAARCRLQECQKYWDDEKRRYDAADKGFRLVCDERDSLSRRLQGCEKALQAYLDASTWDAIHDAHNGARAILSSGVETSVPEKRRGLTEEEVFGVGAHVDTYTKCGCSYPNGMPHNRVYDLPCPKHYVRSPE